MASISEKMKQLLDNHGISLVGKRLVVGISGGADSCAMLHCLAKNRQTFNATVIASHLHHGMRGEIADEDEQFCKDLALELGYEFVSEKINVSQFAKIKKLNIEEAGRVCRYEFFQRIAKAHKIDYILTAHTQNDNAETILLNIFRGTSLTGASGIKFKNENVIRPLLTVKREETEEYCKNYSITYRHDSTNDDLSRKRAWMRKNILPQIKENINPNVIEAITRFGDICREEDSLSDKGARFMAQMIHHDGPLPWPVNHLDDLEPFQLRRVIKAYIKIDSPDANLDYELINNIAQSVQNKENTEFELPSSKYKLTVTDGKIKTVPKKVPQILHDFEVKLEIDRPITIPNSLYTVSVIEWNVNDYKRTHESMEVVISADKVVGELKARNWRFGDKILPLGISIGSKKLSDLFINNKIKPIQKHTLPIIVDAAGVIWVPGLALSRRVQITKKTMKALLLSLRLSENMPNGC